MERTGSDLSIWGRKVCCPILQGSKTPVISLGNPIGSQDQRFPANPHRIGTAGLSGMPSPGHDGIEFACRAHFSRLWSLSISSAALWPGTAETEPPGCVEEPH